MTKKPTATRKPARKTERKPARALRAVAVKKAEPKTEPKPNGGTAVEQKKPQPEQLAVPVALMLAAESICAKADKDKSYLQGVLLHQKDAQAGRIVGSDGVRLFVGSFPLPSKPPSWIKVGLMLPREDLKALVSMISKVGESDHVLITHTSGEPMAMLSDPKQTMVFRVRCGSVSEFPSYERVLKSESFADLAEDGGSKAKREWEPVGFNSQHLKHCGDIAKILESGLPKDQRDVNGMVVRVFDSGEPTAPRVFDFAGWPGAVLVLAAVQMAQATLPLATARILAPAVRGTIAALRAHATRWTEAAAKAGSDAEKASCMAKAEGFQARVADILARAPDLPALEGPKDGAKADQATEAKPPPQTAAEKAAATRKRRAGTDSPKVRTVETIVKEDGVTSRRAAEIQRGEIEAAGRPVTQEEITARRLN